VKDHPSLHNKKYTAAVIGKDLKRKRECFRQAFSIMNNSSAVVELRASLKSENY